MRRMAQLFVINVAFFFAFQFCLFCGCRLDFRCFVPETFD